MTTNGCPCNFRPILLDGQTAAVFRSSDPDRADGPTVSQWADHVGIRTIIDLRNYNEIQDYIKTGSELSKRYPLVTALNLLLPILKSESTPKCVRVNLNLTNWRYRMKVFSSFGTRHKLVISYLYLKSLITRDANEVEGYGARELFNPQEQWEMYATFIDYGTDCLRDVFRILLRDDLYGVLICCHAGKDRTGVISALIMDLMEQSRQQIVDEYVKSESALKVMQDEVDQSFTSRHLDHMKFGRSPASTMEHFLDYLYKRYNGARWYLKGLGFSDEELQKIKTNIANFVCADGNPSS